MCRLLVVVWSLIVLRYLLLVDDGASLGAVRCSLLVMWCVGFCLLLVVCRLLLFVGVCRVMADVCCLACDAGCLLFIVGCSWFLFDARCLLCDVVCEVL